MLLKADILNVGLFCLLGKAEKSGMLKEACTAPIWGKEIRLASASLVTEGCEGSDRK